MVNVHYKETDKKVTVVTLQNRSPVVRTITDKRTGITVVEIYKEGNKKPVETFVYSDV